MAHAGKLTTYKSAEALDLRLADVALAKSWAETVAALAQSGVVAKDCTTGFAFGAMVETPNGPVPVESLMVGDLVLTADGAPQPVLNIGLSELPASGLVRVEAGALGNAAALTLRADHHVVVRSGMAELLFGEYEVLVRVADLVDHYDIAPVVSGTVPCVTLFFARHEIVTVNGMDCEGCAIPEGDMAARPMLKPHEALVLRAPLETNGYLGTAIALRAA